MFTTGIGMTETINGSLFLALPFFLPVIVVLAAAYCAGYLVAARLRMRQHLEIKEEVEIFSKLAD
jgi:uncharacterized integral membrane protein